MYKIDHQLVNTTLFCYLMLQHVSNLASSQLQGARQFPKNGNPSNEAAADLRLRLHASDFSSVIRTYLIRDV